jgi:hypothetical protein
MHDVFMIIGFSKMILMLLTKISHPTSLLYGNYHSFPSLFCPILTLSLCYANCVMTLTMRKLLTMKLYLDIYVKLIYNTIENVLGLPNILLVMWMCYIIIMEIILWQHN